jgi:hypothetical protein
MSLLSLLRYMLLYVLLSLFTMQAFEVPAVQASCPNDEVSPRVPAVAKHPNVGTSTRAPHALGTAIYDPFPEVVRPAVPSVAKQPNVGAIARATKPLGTAIYDPFPEVVRPAVPGVAKHPNVGASARSPKGLQTPTHGPPDQTTTPAGPPSPAFKLKKGRPSTSKSRRNVGRRKAYYEKQLLQECLVHPGNEAMLSESLDTRVGKEHFPNLAAKMHQPGPEQQILQANVSSVLAGAGRFHRARLSNDLCKDLPQSFRTETLGLTRAWALYTQRDVHAKPKKGGQDITTAKYPIGIKRTGLCDEMETVLRKFYNETTIVYSGTKTGLRTLPCSEWEWKVDLYAEYPRLLRAFARDFPRVLERSYGETSRRDDNGTKIIGYTAFKANIVAAVAQGDAEGFDTDQELRDRKKVAAAKYHTRRARDSRWLPMETKKEAELREQTKTQATMAYTNATTFQPLLHTVKPCGFSTFKNFLEKEKCRFTTHEKPHPCTICDNGPIQELALPPLQDEAKRFTQEGEAIPPELRKKITLLNTQLKVYRLHIAQLETGRREINAQLEALAVGEALVLRDFVNHYDLTGKKINCLHWVVQWRTEDGGPLHLLKLRHYCSDKDSQSCSAHYNTDIETFHFKPRGPNNPGFFHDQGITKVFMGGDHGPHFACCASLYHEASCKSLYGIEVEIMWLTSYHAYNRCDGAGAEDSISFRTSTRGGLPIEGAAAWTDMTNESNDHRSWAYHFPRIAQNADTFPKDINKIRHVKKWSHVKFLDHSRGPGILKYRLVTGKGAWTYADLRPSFRAGGPWLCESCSTKAGTESFHDNEEDCPSPEDCHVLPVEFLALLPDPARIQGEQVRHGAAKQKEKKKIYPCKFGCMTITGKPKTSRSVKAANDHMHKLHRTREGYKESRYVESLTPDETPASNSNRISSSSSSSSSPSSSSSSLTSSSSSSSSSSSVQEDGHAGHGKKRNTPDSGTESEDDEEEDEVDVTEDEVDGNDDEDDDDTGEKEEGEDEGEEEEETYEIEKITGHRGSKRKGTFEYLVKWKDYDGDSTWLPVANLGQCDWAKKQYNASRKCKRKRSQKN